MDKYKLVSNIGKGSFGVISKVQRVEDGKVRMVVYTTKHRRAHTLCRSLPSSSSTTAK